MDNNDVTMIAPAIASGLPTNGGRLADNHFEHIVWLARRLFGVRTALLSLDIGERGLLSVSSVARESYRNKEIRFARDLLLDRQLLFVEDARAHPELCDHAHVAGSPFIRFHAGITLCWRGRTIGFLAMSDDHRRAISPALEDALKCLARFAEGHIEVTMAHHAATFGGGGNEAALSGGAVDPLTGCWNNAVLQHMLKREIALSARNHQPFAYIHLQLIPRLETDGTIDDRTQEALLREAAARLKKAIRPYDLIGYLGGGRFAVYAPACSVEVSELLADRIHARILDIPFDAGSREVVVEIKIGIAATEARPELDAWALNDGANRALDNALRSSAFQVSQRM